MNIFPLISLKIRRVISTLRLSRQRFLALNKIRGENPTCVINDCGLHQVSLGRYVTILLKNMNAVRF